MFVHSMKTRSTFGVPTLLRGARLPAPDQAQALAVQPLLWHPSRMTAVAECPGTPGDQGPRSKVSPTFLKFSSHNPSAPPPRLTKGGACTGLTPQSSPGKPSCTGVGSPSSRAPQWWRRRAPALMGAMGPPARPCHGRCVPSSSGASVPGGGVSRPADPSPSTAVPTQAFWVGSAP